MNGFGLNNRSALRCRLQYLVHGLVLKSPYFGMFVHHFPLTPVVDKRFDAWKLPALMLLKGTWVGDLPAMPVLSGGTATAGPNPLKLQDVADALLYLGPRDTLTAVNMPRADLEGAPYGREVARRFEILVGQSPNIFSAATETPQFLPGSGAAPPPLPPPPKSIHDPLPPRPN
jgi:hypothetical protein